MNYRVDERVEWIKQTVKQSGASGVIIGESGGKDSAIVTALCVKALGKDNVLGVSMPCNSLNKDMEHAKLVAEAFGIELLTVNIGESFESLKGVIDEQLKLTDLSIANIKPRLRMTTLYAIGQAKNYLVAGTDNKSEMVMGYFTKWGDGGYDFNPIPDLTVREVLELGKELGVPEPILTKAPSAGLWEGQTDEKEMGVTYAQIEEFITTGKTEPQAQDIIQRTHAKTEHKRHMPAMFE